MSGRIGREGRTEGVQDAAKHLCALYGAHPPSSCWSATGCNATRAATVRTMRTHPLHGRSGALPAHQRKGTGQTHWSNAPSRGRNARRALAPAVHSGAATAEGAHGHAAGARCGQRSSEGGAPLWRLVWRTARVAAGGGGTLASCGAPRVRGGQAQVAHVWAWDDTAHRMIGGRARPARGERPTPRVDRVGPRPKSWGWTDQRRRDGAGRVHPRVDQRRGRSIYRPRG